MSIIKSNMTAPPPATSGGGGPLSSIGEMNSLRFDGNSRLTYTIDQPQENNRRATLSFWVKRSSGIGTGQNEGILSSGTSTSDSAWRFYLKFNTDDTIEWLMGQPWPRYYATRASTLAKFRDPSAWYHMVLSIDLDQPRDSGGITFYVNGVPQELTHTEFNNNNLNIGHNGPMLFGYDDGWSDWGWDTANALTSYLSDVHYLEGYCEPATAFAEWISGTWVPKTYDINAYSPYGANGFHLDFSTRGGHTIQTVAGGNVQLNTSSTSSFLETPVPSNLSPTNQALTFVNDGYLEISPFLPLTDDFTLEAWISRKSGISAPMKAFWADCPDLNDDPSFYFNDGHSYTTWCWPNNYAHEPMDNTDSSWEHVAWVRENGIVNFYRNGTRKSAPVTSLTGTVGANSMRIGHLFRGGMNHIRVSNVARYSGASVSDWQNITHSFTPDSNTMLLITDQNNIDSMTFVDQSGSAGINIGYDSSGNNNHWQEN